MIETAGTAIRAAGRRWKRSNQVRMALACAGLALALGGCETASNVVDAVNPMNWFGGSEPEPQAPAAASPDGYPNLASVPERPAPPTLEATRRQVQEGLVADTENARHADERIRREVDRRAARGTEPVPGGATVRAAPPQETPSRSREVPAAPTADAPPAAVEASPGSVSTALPTPVPAAPAPRDGAAGAAEYAAPPAVPAPSPRAREAEVAAGAPPVPVPSDTASRTDAATRGADAGMGVQSANIPVPRTTAPPRAGPDQIAVIYFESGGAALQPQDREILRQVAQVRERSGTRLRIVGHSSRTTGTSDPLRRRLVNFRMSMERAQAVANELIRQGTPPEAVYVEALGDSQLVYAEDSPYGEAGNRRVEIYLAD